MIRGKSGDEVCWTVERKQSDPYAQYVQTSRPRLISILPSLDEVRSGISDENLDQEEEDKESVLILEEHNMPIALAGSGENTPVSRFPDAHNSQQSSGVSTSTTNYQKHRTIPVTRHPQSRWISLVAAILTAIHSASSLSMTLHLRSSALSSATTLRQPQVSQTTLKRAVHRTTKPNTRLGMAVTTTGAAFRRTKPLAPTLQLGE